MLEPRVRMIIAIAAALLLLPLSGTGMAGTIWDNEVLSDPVIRYDYITRTPIRIDSNADFAAYANGGGNGSLGNPWILENYEINGTGYGYCIYIGNTTNFFVVRYCNLYAACGGYYFPYFPDSGLVVNQVANGTLHGNVLSMNYYSGIYVDYSSYIIVSSNAISGSDFAIMFYNSELNLARYNNLSNNDIGIYLTSAANNTINANNISSNSVGLTIVWNSYHNIVTNNNIHSNTIFEIEIGDGANNNTILSNSLININFGVYLYANSGNSISNNVITSSGMTGTGIYLDSANNTNLSNNTILHTFTGISIRNSQGNWVRDCTVSHSDAGLYSSESKNITLTRNTFTSNNFGVWFYNTTGFIFDSNTISQNEQRGFSADFFNDGIIINNQIMNNYFALYLASSKNNEISYNLIKDSSWGIEVFYSSSSMFHHNRFIDNLHQAYDYSSSNTWDNGYPSGGNYWSDYTGTDYYSGPAQNVPGSDDIGDTHYTNIDGTSGARDRYPLMYPDVTCAGPNVYPIQPSPGDVNVSIDSDIVAVFTKTMDTSAIPMLTQIEGIPVTYTFFGWSQTALPNDTATWTHGRWEKNDAVSLTISGYKDTDGKIGPNCTWVFSTEDDTLPESRVLPISSYWGKASPLMVEANATDLSGISDISLWYRHSPDNATWGEWKPFGKDSVIPWNWSFNFPGGQGHYQFISIANDTVGNREPSRLVADTGCAFDITAPALTDATAAGNATTGDIFEFSATADDNMGLNRVHLEYWFGRRAKTNVTIFESPSGNFTFNIPISDNNLLELYYRFAAVDIAGNWKATTTRMVPITDNDLPIADAGSNMDADEGQSVTFNGTGSTDNIGITNWTWNFTYNGSEISLNGKIANFTFFIPGVYTVTLAVADSAGNLGFDSLILSISDLTPPLAEAGPDMVIDAGTYVTFNSTGCLDNAGIECYTWTFTHNGTGISLEGPMPSFTFWATGNHTITLTVKDAAGHEGTDTMMVSVLQDVPDEPVLPGNPNSSFPFALLLLAAAVAIVLLVLGRRKQANKKPVDNPEAEH